MSLHLQFFCTHSPPRRFSGFASSSSRRTRIGHLFTSSAFALYVGSIEFTFDCVTSLAVMTAFYSLLCRCTYSSFCTHSPPRHFSGFASSSNWCVALLPGLAVVDRLRRIVVRRRCFTITTLLGLLWGLFTPLRACYYFGFLFPDLFDYLPNHWLMRPLWSHHLSRTRKCLSEQQLKTGTVHADLSTIMNAPTGSCQVIASLIYSIDFIL